jgi:hypothetical protein
MQQELTFVQLVAAKYAQKSCGSTAAVYVWWGRVLPHSHVNMQNVWIWSKENPHAF